MHQSPDYERKRLSAWACQDVDALYEKLSKVGSGTYGEVNKARLRSDPTQLVALKKIKDQSGTQGFPITAMREINLLQQCNHPNVVRLLDVVTSNLPDPDSKKKKKKGSTSLVFEYMEHELLGLIQTNQFTSPQIKCIVKQILQGLDYIHSKDIIHRDIKSANILMNNKGEVKIADFGLARKLAPSFTGKFTQRVVTRWYRAPELLLGCKKYTSQIDIWALGCVFAELLMGKSHALFPAQKTPDQFALICEKCGVPSESDWPGHKDLPNYPTMVPKKHFPRALMQYMYKQNKNLDSLAIDLLEKMLTFNPDERINTKEALEHPYFSTSPLPCETYEMPKFDKECHAYVLNIKRKARANINLDDEVNVTNNKAKAAAPNQNATKSNASYNEPIVLSKKASEQPSSLRQANPQPYSGTAVNNSTTTGTYGALLSQTAEQPSSQIKMSQISNMTQLSDMNNYNSLLGFNNYGSIGMLGNIDNLRQNSSMYSTYANTYSGASNIDTNWSSFNEIGNMSNLSNQSNVSNMGTLNHTNNSGNMYSKQDNSLLNFQNNFNFMQDKLSLDYLNYQYCLLRNFSVLHFNKLEQEVLNPNLASFLENKVADITPCWPVIPQSRQSTQPLPEDNNADQKTRGRPKKVKQPNVIRIPAEAINVINDDKPIGALNGLDFDFLNYPQEPGLNCKRTGVLLQDFDQLVKKRQLNNPLDVE